MKRVPYLQGIYHPQAPKKYRGSVPIVYRSKLELTFFRWCDRSQKVLQWGSESVVIPYISPRDGKFHRYFVDAVLHLAVGNEVMKYIVEIKPSKQLMPPSTKYRKKPQTVLYEQLQWAQNQAKWDAARTWCNKHGYKFAILTERDLQ